MIANRAAMLFAYAALAAMMYLLTVSIYWIAFDNSLPYRSQEVELQNESGEHQVVFKAGELMYIYRAWCSDRDAPITTGRYLRSEDRRLNIAVGTAAGMLQKGCWATRNIVQIPPFAPPGKYRYDVVVQWQNNAFHFGIAQLPSFTIDIVK